MKLSTIAAFVVLLFVPGLVFADVHITEVAWMGTTGSQYSEWLELYNDGASSISLAGWKLYEGDGGALVFTFTKSIPANGYLLLERTTASAPDAVPGINDEAGPFGGGGLANTGEDLVLKDSSGTTAEELNFLSGWPAGDATTKETMQWNGSEWITAPATPKADAEGTESTGDDGATMATPSQIHEADPFPIPKVSPNKPMIDFTTPPVIYRGVAYEFNAQPLLEYNFHVDEGDLYWNMGDGTVITQQSVAPIMHTYDYPGTYVIYYSYSDVFHKNAPLTGTKKIRVLAPTITLSLIGNTALEIKNTSTTPVDLSAWKVVASGQQLLIPNMTVIAEKSTATIPLKALGISFASSATIEDPSGMVVARTGGEEGVHTSAPSYQREDPTAQTSEPTDLVAQAVVPEQTDTPPMRNRTRIYIFGAVALFVIVLSILLERFMAQQEYQE